jgi:hypothetical protein
MTMSPDVVLLCLYPVVLLGAAHALHALGRLNTSPWASRPLAGHRKATGHEPDPPGNEDWPHSEVPRLYTVFGLVAAGAATALSSAGLVLHHHGAQMITPAVVLALSVVTLLRMAASARR